MTAISTILGIAEDEVHRKANARLPENLAYTWAGDFLTLLSNRVWKCPWWRAFTTVTVSSGSDILELPADMKALEALYDQTNSRPMAYRNYDDIRSGRGSQVLVEPDLVQDFGQLDYDESTGKYRYRLEAEVTANTTYRVEYWRKPIMPSENQSNNAPDCPSEYEIYLRRFVVAMGASLAEDMQLAALAGPMADEVVNAATSMAMRQIAPARRVVRRRSQRTIESRRSRRRYP